MVLVKDINMISTTARTISWRTSVRIGCICVIITASFMIPRLMKVVGGIK